MSSVYQSRYPPQFIPSLNRVSEFTRNRLSMNTIGLNSFGPYSTMEIDLQDGIADISTLAFNGYATAIDNNSTAAAAGTTPTPVLLPSIERFIDQLTVSIGGREVCNITNYNQIFQCFSPYKSNDKWNIRSIMNMEPGSKECTTPGDGNTNKTVSYGQPALQQNIGFVLTNFLGFLGSQSILYTNRLPTVRISIRFASGNVVAAGSTSGSSPTYQLNNIRGYCDYLTVSRDLDRLLDDIIAKEPLPLVFDNYHSQICSGSTSLTQNNRISTSASCIENVFYTFIKSTNNSPNPVDADTFLSPYFTHGVDELATLCKTKGGYQANFRINGVNIPMQPSELSQGQILYDTLVMLNENQDHSSEVHANLNSAVKFATKFFLHGRSLTAYNSQTKNSAMGIDSRGNSSEIDVNTISNTNAALGANYNMLIVLHLKSVLKMGPGRTCELVH